MSNFRDVLHHTAYTTSHEQAQLNRATDEFNRLKALCEREARYGNYTLTVEPVHLSPQLIQMLRDAGIYEAQVPPIGVKLSWIRPNRTPLLTGRDLIDAGYSYNDLGTIHEALTRAIAEGRVAHTIQAELFWVKEYMKRTLSV